MALRLLCINAAAGATDGPQGAEGVKHAVPGKVDVRRLGAENAAAASDAGLRGALGRVLYAYPSEHLPFWQTVRAQARVAAWDAPVPPGMLGEDLSLRGLVESRVWIGDRLHFADCELVVHAPGTAPDALNAMLGFGQAAAMMAANAWCGFHLGVLRSGQLQAGEAFELVPGPREVGIEELFRARIAARRG